MTCDYFYIYLLILYVSVSCVTAINFDVRNVMNIKVNEEDRANKSYFGYSLLLKKGPTPIVIVGAPKQSDQTGGRIFSCEILTNMTCTKYSSYFGNKGSPNGNFLGSVIDGEDEVDKSFVACAPRKVIQAGGGRNLNYYLKGSCLYFRNSFPATKSIEINPLKEAYPVGTAGNQEYYYDYAFGQAGIDISYRKDDSTLIMGATGVKNWNGAIIVQKPTALRYDSIVPAKTKPIELEADDYLGYKVGYGYIRNKSVLYAGAPRADHLLGKVKLFHNNAEIGRFTGEEVGAYFGSAILAQDVNNDGLDDLFIGAPTAAGASFDEGCVYFYKNALGTPVKLVGKGKKRSRFGTNIVVLGDIDLDQFKDVAIAAPFEDDGVGAVYIFMGGSDGIKTTYSQRIVPSAFPGISESIRGFGMGLSRGNDIDGNGHNDIAVGAYQSGHVFVIPTKSVIDFYTILEPNVTSISSNDTQIAIKFCVSFQPRSRSNTIKSADFQLKLNMDYRVQGPKVHIENFTALPGVNLCKQKVVSLEQTDINPFIFSLETQVLGNIYGEGAKLLEKTIPYSHGCGNDNICHTKITIDVFTNKTVIIGLTKKLPVEISAENTGDPGYQCKFLVELPEEIKLADERRCTNNNSTYSCPFASKFEKSYKKEVMFDVSSVRPNTEIINIKFKVTCLGENLIDNEKILTVLVTMLNSPYIEGKSNPDNIENNDLDSMIDTEVVFLHTFTVGNFGPSPVKADVNLLIPQKQIENTDLFQFVEAKRIIKGTELPCNPTNGTKAIKRSYDLNSVVKSSPTGTTYFDCYEEGVSCIELFCDGDYLYKTTETAKYILKVKTSTKLLETFFRNQPENKYVLAYISSAFLNNGTRIETTATTLLLFSHTSYIPLWVYVVAAIVGILLLGLIIFICYKCHFFDRRFKDKMNSELLMDENIEMEGQEQYISEDDTAEK